MCLSVGLYGESCTDAGCNSCYSKYVKKSELDLFGIDDDPLFVAKDIVENKNSPAEDGSVINYLGCKKSLGYKRGQITRWDIIKWIFKGMGVRLYLLP